MKIKDENGNETEVFTQAEFDAKSKEIAEEAGKKAVEEFQKSNPDKTQEVETLKNTLKKANEDLEAAIAAGGNKEQIERLRKERDDAKEKAEDGIKKLTESFESFKKEVLGDIKKEILDKLSKGDAELRKKIELEFDNYKSSENSKEAIKERMAVAYNIVTGNRPTPNFMDNMSGSGDRGAGSYGGGNGNKIERTENEVKIGKTLGVNDKDVENYEKFKAGQNK